MLIGEYQYVFASDQCKVGEPSWVKFKINLNLIAQPGKQRVCPVPPPPVKANLKGQLDDWLQDFVIEPANSPWASPLVPGKKKNSEIRWASDFRVLNSLTVDDSFLTPNISEVLEALGESKVFSTLDAQNAYHCFSIGEKSRTLTAFTILSFTVWFKKCWSILL